MRCRNVQAIRIAKKYHSDIPPMVRPSSNSVSGELVQYHYHPAGTIMHFIDPPYQAGARRGLMARELDTHRLNGS